MPGPWSRTVTSPALTETSTGFPGGLHLTALSSRLPTARATRAREPLTRHASALRANCVAGAWRRARCTASCTSSSRRRSSGGSTARSPGRARSTRSPTRIVRSSSWPRTEARTWARSPGSMPRARSSSSTLARIEVSGVRSSCEASATSWRWASREASSAPSIALNDAARRPGSSSPSGSMRWCSSPVAVTCSVVAVRRPSGRAAARETATPKPEARPTPPSVTPNRIQRRRPSVSSTSVSGLAICSVEPSGPRAASTRACTPRTVSSRRASGRLPEATSRTAAVVGSDAPEAEGMTSPLESVTCTNPGEPPRLVAGSWASKTSSAPAGSCPNFSPETLCWPGAGAVTLCPTAPPVSLPLRPIRTTLGRCSRSDASTPPRSSWRTTT